ncbi:DUF3558 domain-containing protein [Nocardia stercoris]|uniref:DUF3558 domain-containing protein n=1 Tax=Nocardia stercoris TaxID=2483361 RepID=A0A3M2KZQ2_9NOCA|nr:DUF3558 domain-containing protein [Nocardia stercoris]RMI30949.1 DUF3558 domain-containing protein [Nocardia stercoris]
MSEREGSQVTAHGTPARPGGARGRLRPALLLAVAAVLAVTVSGCGKTVQGTALPAGGSGGTSMDFDKLLHECEVVQEAEMVKAVGAQAVQGEFNGAVCMWDLEGVPGGDGMATLNWYEMGSLTIEKQNNERLGYTTSDTTVQGRRSLQVRRPNDPTSCGIMAPAPDTGIIGWWVNYSPGGPDPCAAATKLAELTLNLSR